MNPPVEVRPYAGHSDDDGIRRLIRETYGSSGVSPELFAQRHFGHSQALQGMMVAEAGSSLVGIQPMELLPHRFAGAPIQAGMLTGLMVHPDWRRQGIFSRLVAACEERAWALGAALVWTMPNEQSFRGFLKNGYANPGERRLMAWAPSPGRLLEKRLPPSLAHPLGWVAGMAMRRKNRSEVGVCEAQEIPQLGEAEFAIARTLAKRWPGLIKERSREWAEWRFGGGVPAAYRFFSARDRNGAPGAWVVSAREHREGLHAGYLMDVVSVDALAALAAGGAAVRALAEEGADVVLSVVNGAQLRKWCRALGFSTVPSTLAPKRFYTVFRLSPEHDPSMAGTLAHIEGWYQTLADWDSL